MTDKNKDLIDSLRAIGFTVVDLECDVIHEPLKEPESAEKKPFIGVVHIEAGDQVLCDLCNKDYTDSQETGGFLFLSNAVCPACSPKFMKSVEKEKEERFIRATAKEGETFRDFVYRIRKLKDV